MSKTFILQVVLVLQKDKLSKVVPFPKFSHIAMAKKSSYVAPTQLTPIIGKPFDKGLPRGII